MSNQYSRDYIEVLEKSEYENSDTIRDITDLAITHGFYGQMIRQKDYNYPEYAFSLKSWSKDVISKLIALQLQKSIMEIEIVILPGDDEPETYVVIRNFPEGQTQEVLNNLLLDMDNLDNIQLDDDVKLNLDSLLSLALNKDFLPEDDAGYKIKLFSNYDKIAIFDNKKLNTPNVDFKSISSFYESWLEKPNPYRRYVPDDVIENIVAYSKDFFQNIDPSLYSGLAEIVDSISRKMENVEIDDKYEKMRTYIPKNIDLDTLDIVDQNYGNLGRSFEVAVLFFKSLSPELGNIAENLLRKTPIYVPYEEVIEKFSEKEIRDYYIPFLLQTHKIPDHVVEDGKIIDIKSIDDINKVKDVKNIFKAMDGADSDNIPLDNSWESVVIAVHEVVHRITMLSGKEVIPENEPYFTKTYEESTIVNYPIFEDMLSNGWDQYQQSDILRFLLSETATIYSELLCEDFVKEKYNQFIPKRNNVGAALLAERYNELKKTYSSKQVAYEVEYFRAMSDYLELMKNEELDENTMPKYRDSICFLDKLYWEFSKGKKDDLEYNSLGDMGTEDIIIMFNEMVPKKTDNAHAIGTVFGMYLYHTTKDDKEKQLQTLSKLLNALSIINEFDIPNKDQLHVFSTDNIQTRVGEDEVASIKESGLPIAGNNGLQIDEDGIIEIISAFDAVIDGNQFLFNNTKYKFTPNDIARCIRGYIPKGMLPAAYRLNRDSGENGKGTNEDREQV